MAMIECPNCRGQISDKAGKCVYCGNIFVPAKSILCEECGAELEEETSVCYRCGCPVREIFRQTKATESDIGKKSKKKIVIAAISILLLLFVIITIGTAQFQKKKTAEETAKRLQEYAENLNLAAETMLSGADAAGSCFSLINQVWYNAIYNRKDTATDKYTQSDGEFVSDFNKALENLFSDAIFSEQIDSIIKNQQNVYYIMKEIESPYIEYEDDYEAIVKLHKSYLTLTNIVINSTGSLNTFITDFDAANEEFISRCQAVKIDTIQYKQNTDVEKELRRRREYLSDLQYAIDTMLSGAADAERCCNLIVKVWENAIWKKKDDATDKYTRPNGYFVEDFNEALDNLYKDSDFGMQIDNIIANHTTVMPIIGRMKNPPVEYNEAYEALSECYDAYQTFTDMAVNPDGSLKSFSSDFDEADTEFMRCYRKMSFYLQE